MQRMIRSPAMPGLIGPQLWTQAETALHRSKATNAGPVDAAGIQKLNMLHILNTNAWAKPQDPAALVRAPSSKLQAPSPKRQASSLKLRKFSESQAK